MKQMMTSGRTGIGLKVNRKATFRNEHRSSRESSSPVIPSASRAAGRAARDCSCFSVRFANSGSALKTEASGAGVFEGYSISDILKATKPQRVTSVN